MGWSNFQTACTKLNVNVVIFYYRDNTVYKRNYHLLASQVLVLWVIRVNTHGGITHNGLRTCGCHYCVTILALNLVAQVVEFALLLFIYNLLIRESCERLWIPVHHTYATVNEAFIVKVTEHFYNALASGLIHCECCAVPVT